MGADLYIEVLRKMNINEEDYYFRDSYNVTNVLYTLGLSYWKDLSKLLDKEGRLKGKNLIKFRDLVLNAEQTLPSADEIIRSGGLMDHKKNTLSAWHKYYREKRKKLIDFLNTAIKLNSSIHCSI